MRKLISASATAHLLILMIERYGKEKGKNIRRARFSRKTILKVSGRENLREAFLAEVNNELVDLGWVLLSISEGFAIMGIASADSWTLIASTRIADEIKGLNSGKLTEEDLLGLLDEDSFDEEIPEDVHQD